MTRRRVLQEAEALAAIREWANRDIVMELDGLDPKWAVRILLAELDRTDKALHRAVWTALEETPRVKNAVAAELVDGGVPEATVDEWFRANG